MGRATALAENEGERNISNRSVSISFVSRTCVAHSTTCKMKENVSVNGSMSGLSGRFTKTPLAFCVGISPKNRAGHHWRLPALEVSSGVGETCTASKRRLLYCECDRLGAGLISGIQRAVHPPSRWDARPCPPTSLPRPLSTGHTPTRLAFCGVSVTSRTPSLGVRPRLSPHPGHDDWNPGQRGFLCVC
jgi:hypothetical protein